MYWKLAKSQMQMSTAYSAWFWAGSASTILRLMIMYFFWNAVYANQTSIQNIDLKTMLTYIVVAMLLQGYIGGVGNELVENIKNGNVAIELMRPYDFIMKLLALDFGGKFIYLIRETFPMLIIAFFFMKLMFPPSLEACIFFIISGILGIWLGTLFDFLIGILAFWTVNVWGLRVLKEGVVTFFSGSLVPIILFPDWLKAVSDYLPFQSMIYVPVSIYTGMISGQEVLFALFIQLAWLLGFYFLVRVIWAQALKQITIFGG